MRGRHLKSVQCLTTMKTFELDKKILNDFTNKILKFKWQFPSEKSYVDICDMK